MIPTERGDLPHGAAERPDVALGGVVQLRLRPERLLRRPPRRVDLLVGRREVRDAEPADLDGAPVRAAEEDVSRAQLAMKYLKLGEILSLARGWGEQPRPSCSRVPIPFT